MTVEPMGLCTYTEAEDFEGIKYGSLELFLVEIDIWILFWTKEDEI